MSADDTGATTPVFNPYPDVTDKKPWSVRYLGPVGIGINLVRPGMTLEISSVEKVPRPGMRVKFRANVPHAWLKEGRNVFAHAHDETMASADALVIGSPWTRRTRSAAPWSGHKPRLRKLPMLT